MRVLHLVNIGASVVGVSTERRAINLWREFVKYVHLDWFVRQICEYESIFDVNNQMTIGDRRLTRINRRMWRRPRPRHSQRMELR